MFLFAAFAQPFLALLMRGFIRLCSASLYLLSSSLLIWKWHPQNPADRLSFMYHLVLILPCSLSLLWLLLESQPWHITTPGGSNLIWEDQYLLVSQRLRFKFFVFIFSIQKIVGMSTINLKECLPFLQIIFFLQMQLYDGDVFAQDFHCCLFDPRSWNNF